MKAKVEWKWLILFVLFLIPLQALKDVWFPGVNWWQLDTFSMLNLLNYLSLFVFCWPVIMWIVNKSKKVSHTNEEDH